MLKVKDLQTLLKRPLNAVDAQEVIAKIPGRVARKKRGNEASYLYRDAGIELSAKDDRISTVWLQAKSKRNSQYTGELPDGLKLSMTRAAIRAKLGEPDRALGSEDHYERGLYKLIVKFADDAIVWVALSTFTPP